MFPSLATPGNITRSIVSATMFPSLARPLELDTGHMTSLPKQNQRIIMIKTYKKEKNRIRRPALVFETASP